MAITPKRLGQAQLTVADQDVYTVPAATTAVIRSIMMCNTTGVARTVRVYLRASGAAADTKAIFFDFPIAANDTVVDDSVHVLPTGGIVTASADAGVSITMTVDGAEVT